MEKYQNRKVLVRFLICIIIVISVVWAILVWNNTHIAKIDTTKYPIYGAYTNGYEMTVENVNATKDNVSITKDYITISGWLVNTNEDMSRVTIDIILVDKDTNEAYLVPTTMQERTDVTEYYGTHNFNWSGYSVKIPFNNKVDTEKHNYWIMALVKINDNDAVILNSGKGTEEFKTNEE